MAATRYRPFGSALHLPDASLAVFFLAGFYLRPVLAFAGLLTAAALIDYLAITVGGVSAWCISPAYAFLIPTYGALWLGGRWYRKHHRSGWRTLVPFIGATITAVSVAFLISNGSFYLFSGRFPDGIGAEYAAYVMKYYPSYLGSTLLYLIAAALLHLAGSSLQHSATSRA
jgi:hypothetical protein